MRFLIFNCVTLSDRCQFSLRRFSFYAKKKVFYFWFAAQFSSVQFTQPTILLFFFKSFRWISTNVHWRTFPLHFLHNSIKHFLTPEISCTQFAAHKMLTHVHAKKNNKKNKTLWNFSSQFFVVVSLRNNFEYYFHRSLLMHVCIDLGSHDNWFGRQIVSIEHSIVCHTHTHTYVSLRPLCILSTELWCFSFSLHCLQYWFNFLYARSKHPNKTIGWQLPFFYAFIVYVIPVFTVHCHRFSSLSRFLLVFVLVRCVCTETYAKRAYWTCLAPPTFATIACRM